MSDELYNGPTLLGPISTDRSQRIARIIFWPLLVLLLFATLLLYVVFTPLRVDGPSMVPTLYHADLGLRTKSYERPQHGDVVVVDYLTKAEDDDIVKRVIGLPGDVVEIRDDIAIVNGKVESVSRRNLVRGGGEYREPRTVPEGSIYVLGDNRPVSLDSRFIGTVPMGKVRGKVVFVFLPLHHFGSVR